MNSQFVRILGDYSRGAGRVRPNPNLMVNGLPEVRKRVALALALSPSAVTVDRHRYAPSGLTLHCAGEADGKRYFAKIFLADPYPIPDRFAGPWERPGGWGDRARSVHDQIATEWGMTLRMRALPGGSCIPTPMGKSPEAKTIVWEEAGGSTLMHVLKRSRWNSVMAKAGAPALFQTGTWLRSVHEASQAGTAIIEARDLIRTASAMARQKRNSARHYERAASKILEAGLKEMGEPGNFAVPVALTHGDLCLSNLLWDNDRKRLAVIDFELSGFRPAYHDLFAIIADIRSALLNPLVPKSTILAWEDAFWRGYGPIPAPIAAFVKSLALARVFYHNLARMETRGKRKGWLAGTVAQLYRISLEGTIVSQRLDLPVDLGPLSRH